METESQYKIDAYRRLCIKKDLIELSQWMDSIEHFNIEMDHLKLIEKQLLKTVSIENQLQGMRRKNTLVMGSLCQYEQELKKEIEFGKRDYDIARAKEHEKRRDQYMMLITEFRQLKNNVYLILSNYQRK
ncbi:hypothetical protein [Nonlabens antarcticus]|uniref:hypothetical protein n=1 Tax=Nonlabens antarcticus TaxID=392714 RepID=UPI00189150DF|nr:hypothetical protein [Nonlabens antarcticus]